VCGYVQALKPFELSGLHHWVFLFVVLESWSPYSIDICEGLKYVAAAFPSSKKRKQHLFERDRSVRATSNALQRKFHANPFFYNSKLWLFVAVSTNLYLYSWKACLLLAVLLIVYFSQGAEANFHKGFRPLPAVHSVSLNSCFSLLEIFSIN